MNPQRVACKLFVRPAPPAELVLSPFIGMFHRFIQQKALDGLLIDVADYAHVPDGPGVLLVGHDFDYGMDLGGGRPGLLTTRKRYGRLALAEAVRGLLAAALRAAGAIERDGSGGVRFATDTLVIQVVDRLAAPNDRASYRRAADLLAPLFNGLYGEKHEVVHASEADPRQLLAIQVTARDAAPAAELVERLNRES
jgi:hypothetical protein